MMKINRIFIFIAIAVFLFTESSAQADQHEEDVCLSDEDCPYHETCHERECVDICTVHNGVSVINKCGRNAFCYAASDHTAFCRCYSGYSGNPILGCAPNLDTLRSCNADQDCPYHELCHQRKCVDVCQYYNGSLVDNKCGRNAYCFEVAEHSARCSCYSHYNGDPYAHCVKAITAGVSCQTNHDCGVYSACYNNKCVDACKLHNGNIVDYKCGRKAYCYISYAHVASCKCLPNFIGDPFTECKKSPDGEISCKSNDECPSHTACYAEKCVDICKLRDGQLVDHKCGVNAYCYEANFHVAECACYPGYSGNPHSICDKDI